MSDTPRSLAAILVNCALIAALAACSPAKKPDPRDAAGSWPPKDFAEFSARPPMSVAAELDDAWSMAIDAERWSYQIGVALIAAGATPPVERGAPVKDYLARAARGLRNAATRFVALQKLACGAPRIAKEEDCSTYAPPPWLLLPDQSIPPKDELQIRLLWLHEVAPNFVQPACAIAIKRTGDQRFCVAE
jgi:hypothetical protein